MKSTTELCIFIIVTCAFFVVITIPSKNQRLTSAVLRNDTNTVVTLIKRGASVNYVTNNKLTPLMIAIRAHHEGMALFLIRLGADTNRQDKVGYTALDYAKAAGMTNLFAPAR